MILLSLTVKEEKSEAVETCTAYDAALAAAFQESVGRVLTPIAPLAGKSNVGVSGKAAVEKFHIDDQGLVPSELEAHTRQ